MTHENDLALVADIEDLMTKLIKSEFNRASYTQELSEAPNAMVPVAYAVMTFLIESAWGSGREQEWAEFLTELLSGCINKHMDIDKH